MLTFNELIELRDNLKNCEISLEIAKVQFWNHFKEGQRAWHTKDWKERRFKFIKDECEICKRRDVLTIQHRSHPRKFYEYKTGVTKEHTKEYFEANPIIDKSEFTNYILKKYDYLPIPLCPNCKNKNPSERVRKTPKFRCADCKHEFEIPIYYTADELITFFYINDESYEVQDKCFVSKDKWKNKHNLSNIRYWLIRDRAKKKNAETIEKETFLRYLDDNIKYLSFEDSITACRKCAASFDLYKMELCPKCKKYYKGIQYPTCIQCLPEKQRKKALESIELGKEWREMHKNLGLD